MRDRSLKMTAVRAARKTSNTVAQVAALDDHAGCPLEIVRALQPAGRLDGRRFSPASDRRPARDACRIRN